MQKVVFKKNIYLALIICTVGWCNQLISFDKNDQEIESRHIKFIQLKDQLQWFYSYNSIELKQIKQTKLIKERCQELNTIFLKFCDALKNVINIADERANIEDDLSDSWPFEEFIDWYSICLEEMLFPVGWYCKYNSPDDPLCFQLPNDDALYLSLTKRAKEHLHKSGLLENNIKTTRNYFDIIREVNDWSISDPTQTSCTLILPHLYKLRYGDRLETVAKMYGTHAENIKVINEEEGFFPESWVVVFPKKLNCLSSTVALPLPLPPHFRKLAKAKFNKIESYLEWLISDNEKDIRLQEAYIYEERERFGEEIFAIAKDELQESILKQETFVSEISKLKEYFLVFCSKIEDLNVMIDKESKQEHPLLALNSFNSLLDWLGECLDDAIFPVKWESSYKEEKGHYPVMPLTQRKERSFMPAGLFLKSED